MSLFINTNINSLNAQRNLTGSQKAMSQALERLSSGLRINSAKDDAAGMAISTRFTTQINGLNQAVRNANDGVSLSQTTESALDEVTNNLQRIRKLAIESVNASNSGSDRAALDQEVQQRFSEITRIATQTTFNGLHVLDGTMGTATFQVGANVGDTISISLSTGVGASQIGEMASTGAVDLSSQVGAAGASVTSDTITNFDYSTTSETISIDGNDVQLSSNVTDIDGLVTAVQSGLDTAAGAGVYDVSNDGDKLVVTTAATGSSVSIAAADSTSITFGTPVAGQDSQTLTLGAGDLTIQVGDGSAVDITGSFDSVTDLASAIESKNIQGLTTYVDPDNNLHLAASANMNITGNEASNLGFSNSYAASGNLTNADVKTVDGSNKTVLRVDMALTSISALRSQLGAIQNRFGSTISNLTAVSQNLSAARSRIQDADFAAETAALTRAQILQNAGISVLAQANATPQAALQLLQIGRAHV